MLYRQICLGVKFRFTAIWQLQTNGVAATEVSHAFTWSNNTGMQFFQTAEVTYEERGKKKKGCLNVTLSKCFLRRHSVSAKKIVACFWHLTDLLIHSFNTLIIPVTSSSVLQTMGFKSKPFRKQTSYLNIAGKTPYMVSSVAFNANYALSKVFRWLLGITPNVWVLRQRHCACY